MIMYFVFFLNPRLCWRCLRKIQIVKIIGFSASGIKKFEHGNRNDHELQEAGGTTCITFDVRS